MERGIVIADTKMEFGQLPLFCRLARVVADQVKGLDEENDEIVVVDELL